MEIKEAEREALKGNIKSLVDLQKETSKEAGEKALKLTEDSLGILFIDKKTIPADENGRLAQRAGEAMFVAGYKIRKASWEKDYKVENLDKSDSPETFEALREIIQEAGDKDLTLEAEIVASKIAVEQKVKGYAESLLLHKTVDYASKKSDKQEMIENRLQELANTAKLVGRWREANRMGDINQAPEILEIRKMFSELNLRSF